MSGLDCDGIDVRAVLIAAGAKVKPLCPLIDDAAYCAKRQAMHSAGLEEENQDLCGHPIAWVLDDGSVEEWPDPGLQ